MASSNNETIGCLNAKDIARVMNILRRIDALNANIDMRNAFFDKAFDSSLSDGNRGRILANFRSQCQFIADWSHIAAKEVVALLRRWK